LKDFKDNSYRKTSGHWGKKDNRKQEEGEEVYLRILCYMDHK
jgi:hypothetical protein